MILFPKKRDRDVVSSLTPEAARGLLLALFSDAGGTEGLTPAANNVLRRLRHKSDRFSSAHAHAGGVVRLERLAALSREDYETLSDFVEHLTSTEDT